MSAEPAWRVYLPEWLAVYTAGYMGDPGEQECRKYFARKYGGRVRDEDWRVRPGGPDGWPVLEVRLPNLRGEFKDEAEATDCWIELPHARMVRRGSAEERELLDYGKKKLPDARGG